jgi:Domain of unknown function (DUF4304)
VVGVPAIANRLGDLLASAGFKRHKYTWNRAAGTFVDVVHIQRSKARDKITVNLGVLDPEVRWRSWGRDASRPVDEAECTVRTRLGRLIGDYDVWWPLDDTAAADVIAEAVADQRLGLGAKRQVSCGRALAVYRLQQIPATNSDAGQQLAAPLEAAVPLLSGRARPTRRDRCREKDQPRRSLRRSRRRSSNKRLSLLSRWCWDAKLLNGDWPTIGRVPVASDLQLRPTKRKSRPDLKSSTGPGDAAGRRSRARARSFATARSYRLRSSSWPSRQSTAAVNGTTTSTD